jgi:ribosomal protein S18 acetylase RimI-like enzyme
MPSLLRLIESNLEACFLSFRRLPGALVRDDPALLAVATPLAANFFNGVARARFPSRDADAHIAAALQPFHARRVPFRWWITPSARPADLGRRLARHGLEHVADTPGMAAGLSASLAPATSPGVTIERILDPAGLRLWIDTFTTGFDVPAQEARHWYGAFAPFGFGPASPWHYFLGRLDGQPAATASLLLGGGAAGIYHVVTSPHARGRGLASALTLAAMRAARDLGQRVAVLQASAMGLNLYRRLGFEEHCRLALYFGQASPS